MKRFTASVITASLISLTVNAQEVDAKKELMTPESVINRLDKDGDGKLSREEFSAVGKTEQQKTARSGYFTNLDTDKNDFLDAVELIPKVEAFNRTHRGKEAETTTRKVMTPESMIKNLDQNKDGKLSEEEFSAVSKSEKEKASRTKYFAKSDRDKDGFLSTQELIPMAHAFNKMHGVKRKKEAAKKNISAFGEKASAGQWATLFNGKDIEGWELKGGEATYKVEDGCIVGTTKPNTPNSFLCPPKKYGDFELTFEVQCDPDLNSGVQIRSISSVDEIPVGLSKEDAEKAKKKANGESLFGPQVEIAATGKAAGIWFEGVGGWLLDPKPEVTNKVYDNEGWNSYRVLAKGETIQVWINGTKISDGKDTRTHFAKGRLGFQVHGVGQKTAPLSVRWKNIRIRKL